MGITSMKFHIEQLEWEQGKKQKTLNCKSSRLENLALLANNMIVHVENLNGFTKKLLEVIKDLGRAIEYKFQRCSFVFNCTSVVVLYLNRKEIKMEISFTVVSEILDLGINSSRKAEGLYPSK